MPLKPATLLDSNAGAPLHPVVREALFAFMDDASLAGNPASLHAYGRTTSALIASAEVAVLRTFGANPREWAVVFTGGGTEANQLAIRSALFTQEGEPHARSWAVSNIEHACVLDMLPEAERRGVSLQRLSTNVKGEGGGIAALRESPTLLSLIGVGNETGIFHHHLASHILSGNPSLKSNRPRYHVDFCAGWGKVDLVLGGPDSPDYVAIASHKLGGLAGVGALVYRRELRVERPGTPNLAGIVGMKALADHWASIREEYTRIRTVRDEFENMLRIRIPSAVVTGSDLPRAPNVTHLTFPGARKDLNLVAQLDLRGFAVSAGSACASGLPEPSHVLLAMGMSELVAKNAIRVSLHPGNTAAELGAFTDQLESILKRHEVI